MLSNNRWRNPGTTELLALIFCPSCPPGGFPLLHVDAAHDVISSAVSDYKHLTASRRSLEISTSFSTIKPTFRQFDDSFFNLISLN